MKKITLLIIVLSLLTVFVISDTVIEIPAKNETISISIPTDVKQTLRDYYRRPYIAPEDVHKVNGLKELYIYLSYEHYNGSDWLPEKKRLQLWTDYDIEAKYISFQNETDTIYSHHSYKDFAEMRIKKAVEKWAFKEYDRLTIDDVNIDIGNKTIDLNG